MTIENALSLFMLNLDYQIFVRDAILKQSAICFVPFVQNHLKQPKMS